VSLDGKEFARATSQVDFGEVAPGAHFVSIEAAGRETQNTPVTVAAGAPTVLSIVLKTVEPTPAHGVLRRAAAHAPAPGHATTAGEAPAPPAQTAPVRRTRAEEHGLMDENPFRKQ
jgi:hypothetical protein